MIIEFNNIATGTTSEMKQTPKADGRILLEEVDKLNDMTKEELVLECKRRERVSGKIWNAIMTVYGPDGFNAVLNVLEIRRGN